MPLSCQLEKAGKGRGLFQYTVDKNHHELRAKLHPRAEEGPMPKAEGFPMLSTILKNN